MNNYWYIAIKDNLAKSVHKQPDLTTHKYMTIEEVNSQYPLNNLSKKPLPESTEPHGGLIQVAPNIFQSVEDYEANMRFDEERDNKLQDEKNINTN